MRNKIRLLFSIALLACLRICAQPLSPISWWNPAESRNLTPGGQGWHPEKSNFYSRLPDDAAHKVRKEVFDLSQQNAGVTLHFFTSAPAIIVEYTVTEQLQFPHMPATGVSGIDLYNGMGQRVAGNYQFGDTIRYRFNDLHPGNGAAAANYTLYLPLYNSIQWMRIGVGQGYTLTPTHPSAAHTIVIYGTSIAQGACASRPAMAWPNLLGRLSGNEIIDLGFSGNGRLEPEVIDYLNQLNPSIYVLDCLPNLTSLPPDSITQKVMLAVEQIRKVHPAVPLLLTEHAGFGNEQTNENNRRMCANVNTSLRKAMILLERRGTQRLYLLKKKDIGLDSDCFVDQVHPNDAGMMRYAHAYLRIIRHMLRHSSDRNQPANPTTPGR